ncbi:MULTISPECIES: hypothetical protein [Dyella]|uniref:hypothetical protein n=1 Tax=Dyella TaxID=231454 RepID=UPI000C836E8C|nr:MULTISPECIES: hypothetical protein [Dyella]MDR3443692.1 hypothetical protein [Dyella sp.]PMQ03786.1 hypothetical protein DyAD56_17900 [Dyella sp. AD56]ULU23807.1 hypothetical protein DYST_00705 [Dyella terrae]
MSEREWGVNEGLRALDDAHRMGRLTRDEYRARRRRLLGTLQGGDSAITRRTATSTPSQQDPPSAYDGSAQADVLPSMFPSRPWLLSGRLWVWATGVLLCALLAYWLLAA